MKIGYLHVSTEDQNEDRQTDGLVALCDEMHVEKLSAVAQCRPIFEAVLAKLKKGDTLVVWSLDRAFRSTVEAIQQAEDLRKREIEFQIVNLGADTSSADGMLIFTVIAAMAEHERKRLSERTKQGLEAARKRGVKLGPKRKMTDRQVRNAAEKLKAGSISVASLAKGYGVHPWTLRRNINALGSG